MMGMLLLLIPVAIALLQPQRSPEQIVLLPNADGSPSAVTVTSRRGETVLDRPYLGASVQADGRTVAREYDPANVQERYGDTLAALPQGPASHVLYFEAGSERMVPESAARLPALRAELRRRAAPQVTLVGHTSRSDAPASNEQLSLARAAAVMRAIMPSLPEQDIGIRGRGSLESTGLPQDRRVEVWIR